MEWRKESTRLSAFDRHRTFCDRNSIEEVRRPARVCSHTGSAASILARAIAKRLCAVVHTSGSAARKFGRKKTIAQRSCSNVDRAVPTQGLRSAVFGRTRDRTCASEYEAVELAALRLLASRVEKRL